MHKKAKNLQELREVAQIAAQEIEETWPEWMKKLSEPKEVPLRAADQGSRRDRADWRH